MTAFRRGRPSKDSPPTMAPRAAALYLLGRRDYTTRELAGRLADRGYDPEAVRSTIDALQAEGLLDDRRFAEAYVRTASRLKGRGRRRIAQELVARGIDRSLAADLTAAVSDDEESAAIDRFLARRRQGPPADPADRRRLFQQLQRRGFSTDAIARALRRHGGDPDDRDDATGED